MNDDNFWAGVLMGMLFFFTLFFLGDGLFLTDTTKRNIKKVTITEGTNVYIYKDADIQFEATAMGGAKISVIASTKNGEVEKWFTFKKGEFGVKGGPEPEFFKLTIDNR